MDPTKIHPVLQDELNLTARSLDDVVTPEEPVLPIIVRMRATRSLDEASILEWRPGLQVERRIDLVSAVAGRATRDEIEALSEMDDVETIWFDEPVYALLDQSVPRIGVPAVWQGGNEGAGVLVAILDTGIDATHPDLAGRIVGQRDFTGQGVPDLHGHGTHVAGTVAGSGVASNGQYRGVAPQASLLVAKVLGNDGAGRMSLVMAAIEWALEQGAQVINLSLGTHGNGDGTDATSVACDAAVEAGAVVVVAAGNDGPGSGTLGSPGCARNVITVGALAEGEAVADFSSRGPTTDGRTKPDVVLPGRGIVAARASGTHEGQPLDERYTRMNGTSMATPHAAGIAALMLHSNPQLRPTQVKELFLQAARSLGLDENLQGKGMVLANRALELAREGAPEPGPVPSPPPAPVPAPQGDGCFAPVARLFRRG